MSTEIYSKQSCQIKVVCQNLETIWLVIRFFSLVKNIVCGLWLVIRYFSLVKKVISVFPPFGAASQSGNVHNFRCFPKVCRHCFSGTVYRRPRKWKHKKKTQQNVALLKEFLTLKNESTYWRNSPKGAEWIHQRIYHYGTKERQQRRLWTQLLTFFDGQFWTVLKKKNSTFLSKAQP